ncbi:arylsulfatase [Saccharicrinis fermentans]|uniref:Arylsulfatase n=1 Tax=Saccharicrinis fermentans DSM 9555 = JCM 21142 TaxID=869213 RepID=W7YKS2_9BACT|nr:arylsulfatase [Saccharicrinis fermentans]GAF05111.1 arylsulfatase [Saccharicrinis fermentans DSM 9555 = JCM 21142]
MIHIKIQIVFVLLMTLGAISCTSAKEKSKPKPNIIYILADDLGYGELGCYGQEKIQTPCLDKMASEGIRFTNHYSGQTVCSPSRCSLMTGMHMGHASVKKNGVLLDASDVTVSELLKSEGYATCAIGKWGLAEGPLAANSPNQKGFDHWFGFDNQGFAHFYYPEFMWRNHDKVFYNENLNIRDENGYYIPGKGTYNHDEFTKEALGFIQENKNKPFFLYLPYAIPHAELTVPEDSKEPYRKYQWPETPKTKPGYVNSNVKDQGYGSQYVEGYCCQDEPNITYAAMVSRMDRDIGRIMDLLKKLDIDENTIIMFGSDNGPSNEGGQSMEFFNSSGGLRGAKRDLYEGGIRVPFIARWPGKIKAGVTTNHISAFWDFLPTVCELVGISIPDHVDGMSLLPTLLGNDAQQKQHKYLYWEWRNMQVLRVGKWKFFYMNSNKPDQDPIYALYDLERDIREQNNVAQQYPELIKTFLPYLQAARK